MQESTYKSGLAVQTTGATSVIYQQGIMLSLVKLSIGMEEVIVESMYLQALTFIRLKQEIIQTLEKW